MKKTNSKGLNPISGKTPPIYKEIWVFPNLNENSPLIFQNTVKTTFSFNIALLKNKKAKGCITL
jgi:hypothetical protein